jgi:nitric oxide reductase NorD protein
MDPSRSPDLEFDWELWTFKGVRGLWRRLFPAALPAEGPGAVRWADDEARWTALASIVAGRPLRLLPAREGGGVRGDDLLLPPVVDRSPEAADNLLLLRLRLLVDATTARRRPQAPLDADQAVSAAHDAALSSVAELSEDLPRFAELWADGLSVLGEQGAIGLLYGRLIPVEGLEGGAPPPDESQAERITHEAQARAIEELKVIDLAKEDPKQMPLHAFEKVELAEAFNGTLRQLDGEDELDDHLESLDEVDLGALLRGGPEAKSLLRAEVGLETNVPDVARIAPGEAAVLTDEWDEAHRRWKRGWCAVYPSSMPRGDRSWAIEALGRHQRLVEQLYSALLIHRQQRVLRGRQLDGEDIDVDAVVKELATWKAGHTPDPRLYTRRPRERRDLAATVLLDLSLSSDAYVDNRRVLDVAREAVLVLGAVAERLGDRVEVLAFASHTRNQVRVWTVRGFDEPWSVGEGRLGLLRPQGYTRIGAAVRYATRGLTAVSATRRLLLLISDGKPTDLDRYEGRYGVADVRMALSEARQQGIAVHALAVDRRASHTLPAMMGTAGWSVLAHPDALPEALTRVWGAAG